jgi:hypothetical protein
VCSCVRVRVRARACARVCVCGRGECCVCVLFFWREGVLFGDCCQLALLLLAPHRVTHSRCSTRTMYSHP